MDTNDLDFDLNSLRVLVALDETRHVTRAAQLLRMSQSGFSTALSRLRKRCGDPLFVRTTHGMEATSRAARMVNSAREILDRVHSGILNPPDFDPLTERTNFFLSMADVAEVVFLPDLVASLRACAPHVSLQSESHRKEDLSGEMESGRIDLAMGYFAEFSGSNFYQQRLYSHTFACMLRPGHPALARPMSIDSYAALSHAVVMSPARTNDLLDRCLEQRRIARNVVIKTPHHLSLPSIISATDLVATVPIATGVHFAEMGVVKLMPLPFRPPLFSLQQHWHKRNHQDPRHRWLRHLVQTLFNDENDRWISTERSLYGDLRGREPA